MTVSYFQNQCVVSLTYTGWFGAFDTFRMRQFFLLIRVLMALRFLSGLSRCSLVTLDFPKMKSACTDNVQRVTVVSHHQVLPPPLPTQAHFREMQA